jgi:hypothetical protein
MRLQNLDLAELPGCNPRSRDHSRSSSYSPPSRWRSPEARKRLFQRFSEPAGVFLPPLDSRY